MKKIIFVAFLLLGACSSSDASCSNPTIKGNLTTYNGEKIYHISTGQYYDVTNAEKMFCTEEEAKADGFRASQR